jgi:CDP-diacylglycerol--serine O-phosphatidyltransferase
MSYVSLFSLPNILTLINLLSGCLAVVFLFNYRLDLIVYCVLVSLVADFLDGFAARFTKTSSELGKQLDSLADVISFGLVPGAIVFHLLFRGYESDLTRYPIWEVYLLSTPGFLLTLFAALRLAKFNIDTRQSDGFIGLATPAATIFIVGLLYIFLNNSFGLTGLIYKKLFLYGITAVISFLMIAELPMFSFKFKSFGWKGNEVQYLFAATSLLLLMAFQFAAFSGIIILYVFASIILSLRPQIKK